MSAQKRSSGSMSAGVGVKRSHVDAATRSRRFERLRRREASRAAALARHKRLERLACWEA